jgi:hypothetical protein
MSNKSKISVRMVIASLLVLLSINTVQASIININHTIDVNNISLSGSQALFGQDVIISEGDRVNYTLDFSGSQMVSVIGMSSWYSWFTQNYQGVASDFTVDEGYTIFVGSALQPATTSSESSGSVHIGMTNFFAATNLTFSGVKFSFKVVDFVNNGPFLFQSLWLISNLQSYTVSGTADASTEGFSVQYAKDVSAPSTIGLLGLALLAARRFRRK